MPEAPANRPHGSGDRNQADQAKLDKQLQDERDKKLQSGEKKQDDVAKRDVGKR